MISTLTYVPLYCATPTIILNDYSTAMQLICKGKMIDSRYFTQANICIDYTKFLRLLNAMPVRFLYFMHPVHIHECVPTACNVTGYIYIS